MAVRFASVVPVLRIYDVAAAKRFYLDYLGCTLDWQDGEGDRPVFLRVSRGDLVLYLSSHSDDGTPGSAVVVETTGLRELYDELLSKDYPFLRPGWHPGEGPAGGTEVQLIDPFSNRVRFFEPAPADAPD